jgi:hypothetical protein
MAHLNLQSTLNGKNGNDKKQKKARTVQASSKKSALKAGDDNIRRQKLSKLLDSINIPEDESGWKIYKID